MSQDEIAVIIERSRALEAEGRGHENVALLAEATARFPDSSELLLLSAAAALPFDDEAVQGYLKAAARVGAADPNTLTRCAEIAINCGWIDLAQDYSQAAADVSDEEFALVPELMHVVGRLAIHDGNDAEGETLLQEAFAISPGTFALGANLARYLISHGRAEDALEVISQAERSDPANRGLLNGLRRQAQNEQDSE